MNRNVLNDTPQSKLQSQVQNANLGGKLSDSQGKVNSEQANRPEQPQPKLQSSNIPPVQPDLPTQPGSRIKDADGKERIVPEQEEEGFVARLKRKIKEEGQAYLTDKLMGSAQPEGELKNQDMKSDGPPKTQLGKESPKAERPEPKRPEPPAGAPAMPKLQVPRVAPPKLGKIPRIM
jgi:hypothetical protein